MPVLKQFRRAISVTCRLKPPGPQTFTLSLTSWKPKNIVKISFVVETKNNSIVTYKGFFPENEPSDCVKKSYVPLITIFSALSALPVLLNNYILKKMKNFASMYGTKDLPTFLWATVLLIPPLHSLQM